MGCMDVGLVQLPAHWYSRREVTVVWLNTRSTPFAISDGTKQEGILFTRYAYDSFCAFV